jgi:hypothetical protein
MLAVQNIHGAVTVLGSIFGMAGFGVFLISLSFLSNHLIDGERPERQVEGALQRCSLRNTAPLTA